MGGPGSGRTKRNDQETRECIAEGFRIAERAAPKIMQQVVSQAESGVKWAQELTLSYGMGKPSSRVDINVSGTVLHLTAEDVLRQRELLAAQDTLLLGDGS